MICGGGSPPLHHFHGLTAAPLAPPTCRRLPPDYISFSLRASRLKDIYPLSFSKKRYSRALRTNRPMPRHVGGLVLDEVLPHRPPARYRDRLARRRIHEGCHLVNTTGVIRTHKITTFGERVAANAACGVATPIERPFLPNSANLATSKKLIFYLCGPRIRISHR